MQPIPETIELADELSRELDRDFDVLRHLQGVADKVQAVVPDCVGLSIAWLDRDVAFTLVASDEEIALLDAVQYLAGGPCVEAGDAGGGLLWEEGDPLDERGWQAFTQATAARAIRSTLTMPLLDGGRVVGTANLYAASAHAFEDRAEELAGILGGSASQVVANADLSFSTRSRFEEAPAALRERDLVDHAVGILIGALGLEPSTAEARLVDAAARAGLTPQQLARGLVALFDRP
ncbi:ANTAR domain-containing protein [Nocardioides aurantiacus]|uniref:ANTAR domain-containing protein n=1 Tax=Nocardioides aurantiacus TaxID=86796 RepID=UPI00403F9BBA